MSAGGKQFLASFLNHKTTQAFYEQINSLPVDSDYPFFNYIGVNFKNNAISKIKLYCTVFQKFSLAEIEKIIPSTRDFKKYYPYFQEVKTQSIQHSGCAFTLKADADFNFITGFHFRINQGTEILLPPPVHVQLSQADAENFPGVAFEYAADGAAKKKNYYYITDPATKNQIAAEWNNPAIAKAEAIEYTESDEERKIILWNDFWQNESKAVVPFSTEHEKYNQMMLANFGLPNRFAGIYFNQQEHAGYFSHITGGSRKSFSSFDTYQFLKTAINSQPDASK
jgi:hypothetical protein